MSGSDNTFTGFRSGHSNDNGAENTFYGYQSGYNNQSGGNNTYLGYKAGYNNTPASRLNIEIRGQQVRALKAPRAIGNSIHTATYIAGISGISVGYTVAWRCSSIATGSLELTISSLRFKEQVRDMGDSTNALMKLRPARFSISRSTRTGSARCSMD